MTLPELQNKFILDWCTNLSRIIDERKNKTQDFGDIEKESFVHKLPNFVDSG